MPQTLAGAPAKVWGCMAVGSLGAESPMVFSLGRISDRRSEFFTPSKRVHGSSSVESQRTKISAVLKGSEISRYSSLAVNGNLGFNQVVLRGNLINPKRVYSQGFFLQLHATSRCLIHIQSTEGFSSWLRWIDPVLRLGAV